MYSILPLQPLHGAIVASLAEEPGLTMEELQKRVQNRAGTDTSLQHIYRIVTKLTEAQIIMRQDGRVFLNLMWLSSMSQFAEQASQRTLQVYDAGERLPLDEGQRIILNVHSLQEIEVLWNQVLVRLYGILHTKILHKYNSHAWWQLRDDSVDTGFYGKLAERGIRCTWLFGNNTALDQEAAQKLNTVFRSAITEKPPFPTAGYNMTVYGDYILECLFPQSTCEYFEHLFQSEAYRKSLDENLLRKFFNTREDFHITLWRNAHQASILRSQIQHFFNTSSVKASHNK